MGPDTHDESRPAWPNIHAQLVAARAPAGSQLERVIQDNQEIGLLDPAEAADGLPFPPWLRIRWRKAHAQDYPPGAPPVYPLVLERVLEFMIHNPNSIEQAGEGYTEPSTGGSGESE